LRSFIHYTVIKSETLQEIVVHLEARASKYVVRVNSIRYLTHAFELCRVDDVLVEARIDRACIMCNPHKLFKSRLLQTDENVVNSVISEADKKNTLFQLCEDS